MFHVKHRPMSLPDPESWIPAERRALMDAYAEELRTWNARVNLISRSSEHTIRRVHIPHCLSIAWRKFPPGSRVADFGTGGGLPAVPLAICFPDVSFVAIDSKGKKVAALKSMCRTLGLDNVVVVQGRAETWDGEVQYTVSRAAAPLDKLWKWSGRVLHVEAVGRDEPKAEPHGPKPQSSKGRSDWTPGLICLKGGDLGKEMRRTARKARLESWALADIVSGAANEGKYILHATALK
jgi:16S rRNA (guanine527-N7)-methyltransferase